MVGGGGCANVLSLVEVEVFYLRHGHLMHQKFSRIQCFDSNIEYIL